MKARLTGLALACAIPITAQVAATPRALAQPDGSAPFAATTLSLSAEGEVQVAPDEAWLQTGVTTEAPTAAEAVAQDRAKMNAAIAVLRAQGLGAADIQTSALQLSPRYADADKGPPRLEGYTAHNIVTVRVRDLARVGAVVDALVAAGANEIAGVDFDLADRGDAENQARRLAAKALEAKASLYADAMGYRVRRLVSLSEGDGPVVAPMARMAKVFVAAGRPTPIAAGELTVRVEVSAEYELAR